ncbi:hypothetical protein SAY87_015333 [Trapa incisa]|uniref:Uncharacterized protein n=1 Tax=Trapa incisa TaxID=236973 RepID=A0AAN7JLB2_9MYRT|nr:hypothetical protein SAY87_015333 [Trapa incisa]
MLHPGRFGQPQYTLLGIDTQRWQGVHPNVGLFIDASPFEVVVRKWNQQEERLAEVTEEERE